MLFASDNINISGST